MCIPHGVDRGRGYTLIEILIAAGLALLILGVMVQLVISGMKVSEKGTLRAELQQKALLFNQRFERDLRLTAKSGLGIEAALEGSLISIHRRKQDLASVVWEEHTVLYELLEETLVRKEIAYPGPPEEPFKPGGFEQWNWLQTSPGKVTLRLDSVSKFEALLEDGPLIRLSVEFLKQNESLNLERMILLRQGA